MTASLSEDADESLLKAKLKVEKVPNLTFISRVGLHHSRLILSKFTAPVAADLAKSYINKPRNLVLKDFCSIFLRIITWRPWRPSLESRVPIAVASRNLVVQCPNSSQRSTDKTPLLMQYNNLYSYTSRLMQSEIRKFQSDKCLRDGLQNALESPLNWWSGHGSRKSNLILNPSGRTTFNYKLVSPNINNTTRYRPHSKNQEGSRMLSIYAVALSSKPCLKFLKSLIINSKTIEK